jgi:hypothetical protein
MLEFGSAVGAPFACHYVCAPLSFAAFCSIVSRKTEMRGRRGRPAEKALHA